MTLRPTKGANRYLTITVKPTYGLLAEGTEVSCEVSPLSLTDKKWRTADGLLQQFREATEARRETIRKHIQSGVIRLGISIAPQTAWADPNGKAVFRVGGFHICGNDDTPASDMVLAKAPDGTTRAVVQSAVDGLELLQDDKSNGIALAESMIGRHLQPKIIEVLRSIGRAWLRERPPGTPECVTITAASLRWGGIYPPHSAHRFGGAVDIRPIGVGAPPIVVGSANYHRPGTELLVAIVARTCPSQIIFHETFPSVTYDDPSHSNHIHVSWLAQPQESFDDNTADPTAIVWNCKPVPEA